MQELILLPEEESIGERADKYLAVQLPQYSRSFFQKLFKDDQIQIQNTPIKASYRITGEEEIALTIPDAQKPDIVPENIPLDILYEDQDLLVVNKPKGMVVHPAHGHYSGTLVNALMYHCKDSLSGINGVLRPGLVHRIDMDTTGSLIVCKTDMAHKVIAAQLKEHSIHRCYCAIVHGVIKEDSGVISALIYPIEAHWIWGGGWLSQLGFHDFAGSCAIHMVGGISALIGAKLLGPRIGKFEKDKSGKIVKVNAFPGHNLPIGCLGVFILWLGWYGFNGAACTSVEQLGSVFLTTSSSSSSHLG